MVKASAINILLADDHQMFMDGIKALLGNQKKFKVVAEALNGLDALNIISSMPIDIIIADISMPQLSGIELTKKVKEEFPHIKVLVVSMYNDREIVSEIIMAEADGYILKNTGKQELVNALEKISNNGTFYSHEIYSIMMEKVKKEKKTENKIKDLTSREIEIIKLIMQEYSSEDIAEKLFISKRTVDTHRKNILEKTQAKTIVGLLKFAIANNLA